MLDSAGSVVFPNEEFDFQDNAFFMPNPPAEIFGDLDAHDFMFSEPMDLSLGISNFDATGFVYR